ncbi:MAG: hypothetical protein OXU36_07695 [Candidatus Poribacteria bacterium]|nr:hypothetical protein [Candidatus Poribacteria bacterium]
MYGLDFKKVEGIIFEDEVAVPTPEFRQALKDNPEEVERNGYQLKWFGATAYVIKMKSDLVTNIDLKI